MSGHLACLGIAASTPEEMDQSIAPLFKDARWLHRSAGGFTHHLWQDPSGAAIAFHLQRGAIQCMTPFYAPLDAGPPWLASSDGPLLDPGCLDCSGAICDVQSDSETHFTRAAVQFLFFRPYRKWLAKRRRYPIHVTAFATELDVFATHADFEKVTSQIPLEGPEGVEIRFGENFFIPTGLFGDSDEGGMTSRARALFAGQVTGTFLRTNRATGKKFWHLRIETLPGGIDLVHPEREGFYPARGQLALAGVWLVGRPVDPPPRGLLSRLLGG